MNDNYSGCNLYPYTVENYGFELIFRQYVQLVQMNNQGAFGDGAELIRRKHDIAMNTVAWFLYGEKLS